MKPVTNKEGTMTTRGVIPYYPCNGIDLHVKQVPGETDVARGRPRPPVTVEGFLVFALPGGGDYVSGIVVGRNER